MNLVLHIGTPRTGSTAIQIFCDTNRESLLQNNVLFPKTGFRAKLAGRGWRTPGHDDLIPALRNNYSTILEDLRSEIAKYPNARILLVSSENFSLHPDMPKLVMKKFNYFDKILIIIYLRRQDLYLESLYGEFISGGWYKTSVKTKDFFLNYKAPYGNIERNYYRLITNWSETFGKENIIVRPFEKEQWFEGDLIKDFFNSAKLPWSDSFELHFRKTRNISLSTQVYKVLRELNSLPLDKDLYREAIDEVYDKLGSFECKKKKLFSSPKLRNKILYKYKISNARVAKEYLGDKDGILFRSQPVAKDEPWEPVKVQDPEIVLEIFSIFLRKIKLEIDKKLSLEKEKFENQKKQLDNQQKQLDNQQKQLDNQQKQLDNQQKQLDNQQKQLDVQKTNINKIVLSIFLLSQKSIRTKFLNLVFRKQSKEYTCILKSKKFDSTFYLKQYPEVIRSGMKPEMHYIKCGAALGYNPSNNFDTVKYLTNNFSVALRGSNPLADFCEKKTKKKE
jgi:hypothetical protein